MKRTTPKCWREDPRAEARVRLAKWFAGLKGFSTKAVGGWIYGPSGKPVAQGWPAFYRKYRAAILELVWGFEDAGPIVTRLINGGRS